MSAAKARAEADAARADLLGDIDRLKARLSPATLVNDAVESAREKAIDVAGQTVESARARPVLAGSVAGGALLLLARKPLFALMRRLSPAPPPEPDPIELVEGHPS
ncbi:hypothetical protein COC42_00170 [Sphingomonas spermidinifaciens]|uniref:DUF3618 domain-containing protein n=1 Tax=Sphingomonas spermidinifaciens TaxID=1141889 RepID=A0A2A4B4M6_9SPHN|nr:DUF3618 domain-containing protein [Sphingomonas spermidinifaciens]PCD02902.1 hypothetical protein COC42_00170 [Sphingomonas spermidinifaciens]